MYRYLITISYCGTQYCGWQRQPNGLSVQEELEKALYTILRTPTATTGAGRTDAGVHALNMPVHFDSDILIADTTKFVSNLNSLLPHCISVNHIQKVNTDFHARFDAISRRYEYHIVTHKDPFAYNRAYRITKPLDIELMNKGAQILFEYTDFTSFSKLHTDVKTNNCTIIHAHWDTVNENQITFTIEANRFLRNMVRAIVGTLLDLGSHKIDLDKLRQIIESRNRCNAGHSVPACGLYFIEAKYNINIK